MVDMYGSLGVEEWRRVARPYRHLGPDESYVYDEVAWAGRKADGSVESGYEVGRRANLYPVVPRPDMRPVRIAPGLESQILAADPDDRIEILVRVRDFPDWDIPMLPPAAFRSARTNAQLAAERQTAITARKATLTDMSSGIESAVEAMGGSVLQRLWYVGYLRVEMPVSRVMELATRAGVASLEPQRVDYVSNFNLGDAKYASRTDQSRFYYANHPGWEPNYGRHSYGRVTAAVIEAGLFEDEACMYQTGSGNCGNHSTDRVLKAYECDSGSCVLQSNGFSATDEGTFGRNHGTLMSSILAGDYLDGQGDGRQLGDPNWTSGAHSYTWEWDASSPAPEAYMMLLGANAGCGDCFADSIATATEQKADVINGSWSHPGNECDPNSGHVVEWAAEIAYDDGVFFAACSGNDGVNGGCNVSSPADMPKTFTVGGLDSDAAACLSDYSNCVGETARGGATIEVDGQNRSAALVDILGPGEIRRATSGSYLYGTVLETYVGGCSVATPYVAGSAVAQKDLMLDEGHTWINNPGRLHAQMLAMGDSWHHDAGSHQTNGLDDVSGVGRLKMRLFDTSSSYATDGPWHWKSYTNTFTSTGTTSFMFDNTPMGTGTDFLKCVLWEGEDMTYKNDMSDVYLDVDIRQPVNGSCSSSGSYVSGTQDASYDIRHMANIDSSTTTLAGNCAEIKLHRAHVTWVGTTVTAFCYSAGVEDNEY